ncbi:STAS/SEC14 domain-containing protein [Shewanella sp. SG41-4]|uniref:STAS/SEC14 domain-containing protein n=1 Tax=Shewanella sp. SG41-4 TaxID=2760976 RepID=UPI001603A25B|nr:STAS/SEC14 domain-containing protein [Shewanella sp. SG41-4]MBB1440688.1 STAS/SEC14 domain-containing protein [Shewanella sp. SG41-4]
MLQFIPVFDGNTIAVRASGQITLEDYQQFLPQLETQIKRLGKISLLFEFDNFSGWDLDAAIDDIKFGMKHLSDFERIAMVGDKSWEHWMALIAKPFLISSEVRYFNRENLQQAWDWLREKQEFEKAVEQLQPYQNIVVAVDFSLYSKHACKRAIELANYYQASLTLLNVVPEVLAYTLYGDPVGYNVVDLDIIKDQNKKGIDAAQFQMKAFVKDLDTDFPIETKVICGEINYGVVSFLEAQHVDLAIFGAKKKKGINKLLGSVPHYVQNHSRCEILIVPVQEPVL